MNNNKPGFYLTPFDLAIASVILFLLILTVIFVEYGIAFSFSYDKGGNIVGGERCILVKHTSDCTVGKGERKDRTFL